MLLHDDWGVNVSVLLCFFFFSFFFKKICAGEVDKTSKHPLAGKPTETGKPPAIDCLFTLLDTRDERTRFTSYPLLVQISLVPVRCVCVMRRINVIWLSLCCIVSNSRAQSHCFTDASRQCGALLQHGQGWKEEQCRRRAPRLPRARSYLHCSA